MKNKLLLIALIAILNIPINAMYGSNWNINASRQVIRQTLWGINTFVGVAWLTTSTYWLFTTWQEKDCFNADGKIINNIANQEECKNAGGDWLYSDNFDNAIVWSTVGSIIPLFTIAWSRLICTKIN